VHADRATASRCICWTIQTGAVGRREPGGHFEVLWLLTRVGPISANLVLCMLCLTGQMRGKMLKMLLFESILMSYRRRFSKQPKALRPWSLNRVLQRRPIRLETPTPRSHPPKVGPDHVELVEVSLDEVIWVNVRTLRSTHAKDCDQRKEPAREKRTLVGSLFLCCFFVCRL